jgi:hypothetical protein
MQTAVKSAASDWSPPYADDVFRAVLASEGAGWLRRKLMYVAVVIGGGKAYRSDQARGPRSSIATLRHRRQPDQTAANADTERSFPDANSQPRVVSASIGPCSIFA